jgi:hypothetical protein
MPKTKRANRTRQANNPPKDEQARQNFMKYSGGNKRKK